MKTCIKTLFVLPVVVGLGSLLAGRVAAQTFTPIYSFSSATARNSSG